MLSIFAQSSTETLMLLSLKKLTGHLICIKIDIKIKKTYNPISRFNRSPKRCIWYPKKDRIDMSKAGLITHIPNSK
jgi:hypothetical protein